MLWPMSQYYRDYIWREGIPYGIEAVEGSAPLVYKIPMDPYRKRIVIEKYMQGKFSGIVYDSAFLDFRHLKPAEQTAWQKCILSEDDHCTLAAIYNQDDRLIVMESYFFENNFCRQCKAVSGHGIPISQQKIFYKHLGDAINGVLLLDINDHPVMFKNYTSDESSGEFLELIEELWDGKKIAENLSCYFPCAGITPIAQSARDESLPH